MKFYAIMFRILANDFYASIVIVGLEIESLSLQAKQWKTKNGKHAKYGINKLG